MARERHPSPPEAATVAVSIETESIEHLFEGVPRGEHTERLGMFKTYTGAKLKTEPRFFEFDSMYGLTAGTEVVGAVTAYLFDGEISVLGGKRTKELKELQLHQGLDGHGDTYVTVDLLDRTARAWERMYKFDGTKAKWERIEDAEMVQQTTKTLLGRLQAENITPNN